jgi:hypothetical protein
MSNVVIPSRFQATNSPAMPVIRRKAEPRPGGQVSFLLAQDAICTGGGVVKHVVKSNIPRGVPLQRGVYPGYPMILAFDS